MYNVYPQVQCSNGQLGFGRRRREISRTSTDPNKVRKYIMVRKYIKVRKYNKVRKFNNVRKHN